MGRRTEPLIKDPVPFEANADFVEPPSADGGRPTLDADDAVEVVLAPKDLADCDFTGV